jgi:branched-chain amino acid transport system permease protein
VSLTALTPARAPTARQIGLGAALFAGLLLVWMVFGVWPDWLDNLLSGKKAFISAILNGVTLAGLYFLVASGFTLVFGVMRNVNLAHGSLYLLGAYIGYDAAVWTNNWFLGVLAGAASMAAVGALLQIFIFQRLMGDELRQTLVTIGISIVAADLMLAYWGGKTYQFSIPSFLDGAVATPIVTAIKANGTIVTLRYPLYRLIVFAVSLVIGVALWLAINRTKFGSMIRAGVDDRAMLSTAGVNVRLLFVGVFALGGALAGLSGVIGGSALSIAPGEDVRYLMASLVVVIVGGMGSIVGAAVGALLVGLAEQLGLVYFPTYGVVLTFVIMVVTLAFRPQGILGNARMRLADPVRPPGTGDIVSAEFNGATAALAVALILFPIVASPFIVLQIGSQTLILGMIALSLMVLAGYGGMVSMAQLTVAGVAGYAVAILGSNTTGVLGLNWPWWLYVPAAIVVGGIVSALIGAIAVRTAGIYTIMITLATGTAFFYLAQQNYTLFNGHSGFRGVAPPTVLDVAWRDPIPFYYLCLGVAAIVYSAVVYASRSPFGLALMASRDNPRRTRAVGHSVTAIRIAAFFLSGLVAGAAGVLFVWFNGRISPGTVSISEAVGILVIAVIGGLRHPIGPFLGAALYVMLKTFAIDLVGADRFNTLIGAIFLIIVFVSPDGILGLWRRLAPALAQTSLREASRGRLRETKPPGTGAYQGGTAR